MVINMAELMTLTLTVINDSFFFVKILPFFFLNRLLSLPVTIIIT